MKQMEALRLVGKVKYKEYIISVIANKCLTVKRKTHSIHIYDMYNFYQGSLNYNAEKYLGKKKIDIETKDFTKIYVINHWKELCAYCVQDAILVKELAELLISKFEGFGVYPKKLFSTAYVSYQFFRQTCNYVTVKRFWEKDRKLLDYAMRSYEGGKFEVTERGTGYYYEYDIVSAYPYEIANLVDLSKARVQWSKKYERSATYGFIDVRMKISRDFHSPIVVKSKMVNTFPIGYIQRIITKKEYEYLITHNIDVTIMNACWIYCQTSVKPYSKAINYLIQKKNEYKSNKTGLEYHTTKILMNSLYGKFWQTIKKGDRYEASSCWNPIYASIITANTRIKISDYQNKHPSIIAVHTDSIISKKRLNIPKNGSLGEMVYDCEGDGVMVGCGVFQIGNVVKFRGFNLNVNFNELFDTKKDVIKIDERRVYTWREITFHGWDKDMINRFVSLEKELYVNFDVKRYWLTEYKSFRDILKYNSKSLPLFNTLI